MYFVCYYLLSDVEIVCSFSRYSDTVNVRPQTCRASCYPSRERTVRDR